jgi:copper(I)-binding protein
MSTPLRGALLRARPRRLAAALVLGATLGSALLGCGSDAATDSPAALAVEDAWVKATDDGMTAMFGEITNGGSADVVVVGGSTDAAAMVELHEVVMSDGEMVMQPKEGGFTVPAGGSHLLEPGADHVMLMDVTGPIEPGEDVTVTLTLADGSRLEVVAQAKAFAGAEEDYDAGMGHSGMDDSGMDDSGMDDSGMDEAGMGDEG